jgi:PilZ domain
MSERRRHGRREVFLPMRIDSREKSDRIGVTRNASESGLLIGTPSHFAVGDHLELTFAEGAGVTRALQARVVRVALDPNAGLFRRLVAVELAA